ncbi:hypothetical protein Emtol_2812 [Emticicia oligotrophica DSM 17448]|uniref:Uncharacterized protein n=1 Tax=Emticicia oligotrophica (strain DSM 17448 / CIP 109782 / MTCC 6937 / GPTSA100-15) TaxID=929562 RepID=A0ABN4ANK2_EMTOG|nr:MULTISPECIES: hypothetical protein [Emticicia]AFK03947.1 hypothetical protein Emtol_2812 [Emticicia oligotrophica DSM 17448]
MTSSTCKIDERMYNSLLELLNDTYFIDTKGNIQDFQFYHDDHWLSDSAVIDNLIYKRGEWNIELLFALHTNPLKFIKRQIMSYSCPKKATLSASLMRRMAAKDQRGTLEVKVENFNICTN